MSFLVDTSVLVRLTNVADAFHATAARAVLELHGNGELLQICPQNLIEFRNAATRPIAVNGLGLSTADAESKAASFEAAFPLLPETPDLFPAWKSLVEALGIIGKQVHDARLVATCHMHGVSHLLTFNVGHFSRMSRFGPTVTIVEPSTV